MQPLPAADAAPSRGRPTCARERERERDPENFRREYLAEFTEAISSFLMAEQIEQCVVPGRTENPPDEKIHYIAAVDAAFKGDRFTMAIVHQDRERDMIVVDCLRGWQGTRQNPLRLKDVMPEIKQLAEQKVTGELERFFQKKFNFDLLLKEIEEKQKDPCWLAEEIVSSFRTSLRES